MSRDEHPHHAATTSPLPTLPVAVQVGFSGSRRLFEVDDDRAPLEALRARLSARLVALHDELGLSPQHFLVGVSQLAIGGDTVFAEALAGPEMAARGTRHRVLLPQAPDEFFAAGGAGGPDFTAAQAAHARRLLGGPAVIEASDVAGASDRHDRLHETNVQILREADLMVCLRRKGSPAHRGGTAEMVERIKSWGKPLLDIEVSLDADGALVWQEAWHGRAHFVAPRLPHALELLAPPLQLRPGAALPPLPEYADRLRRHGTERAGLRRRTFRNAALVIIGTHVVATVLAAIALRFDLLAPWLGIGGTTASAVVVAVVLVELALLASGLYIHGKLHRDESALDWATSRLCAEVARSARAYSPLPFAIGYLQTLPFPQELLPLLRTLNVLHLDSRPGHDGDLQRLIAHYCQSRLTDPKTGQGPYFETQRTRADAWFRRLSGAFTVFSATTMALIGVKLLQKYLGVHDELFVTPVGVLGVWFPVLAVGAMSFAAALDYDARRHTFAEMTRIIGQHQRRIEAAQSLRELALLVSDLESRLLGEALSWYSRRVFASVA